MLGYARFSHQWTQSVALGPPIGFSPYDLIRSESVRCFQGLPGPLPLALCVLLLFRCSEMATLPQQDAVVRARACIRRTDIRLARAICPLCAKSASKLCVK